MNIYEEITRTLREGKRGALATITSVHGSIPSVAAAKMLIREDGSIAGTVGGGCVEGEVRKVALEVMRNERPKTMSFNLDQMPDDDSGLVCGGSLQVFIEPVLPAPVLYVFGAGHVGLNVYKIAHLAGFEVVVVDDRDVYANRERFPHARDIHAGQMDQVLSQLAPSDSSFLVIVTRGHRHDMRVLRWALDTPARYIGMIGSGRKVLTIFQELEGQGVPRAEFDRVYAPIGLELGATTPEEIAVSIVAELIAAHRKCPVALPHLRNRLREPGEGTQS